MVTSFDGMGFGFSGPQGPSRNAALDNSLAVGPNHIVQVINGAGIAVYTKKGAMFDTTGKVLYGAVPSKPYSRTSEARAKPRTLATWWRVTTN